MSAITKTYKISREITVEGTGEDEFAASIDALKEAQRLWAYFEPTTIEQHNELAEHRSTLRIDPIEVKG